MAWRLHHTLGFTYIYGHVLTPYMLFSLLVVLIISQELLETLNVPSPLAETPLLPTRLYRLIEIIL